jgi:HEAT repeats
MIQEQLQQMVITTLLTTLQDPNPEIRAKSVQALGTIGPTTIIPHRLTTLQDPAPIVRQNAAIALGKLSAPPTKEPNPCNLRSTSPTKSPSIKAVKTCPMHPLMNISVSWQKQRLAC